MLATAMLGIYGAGCGNTAAAHHGASSSIQFTTGSTPDGTPLGSGIGSAERRSGELRGAARLSGSDAGTNLANARSNPVRPVGPSGQPSQNSTTYAELSRTGRGWDAKSIYLGFGVETDASTAGHSLGVNTLDFGDMKGMANALVAYVNSRGGLFGRKLVAVFFDANTAQALSNPDQVGQAACTTWTQDRPVAAILITTPILDTESLFDCAAHHDTPVVAHSEFAFTAADLRQLQPYLTLTDNLSFDRLADPWLQRLNALGYFNGWNTAIGAPGDAPAKVGIIYQSSAWADHAFSRLVAALAARHMPADVVTFQGYSDPSLQSAIVKFHQDGVTHVFLDFWASITFPAAAEQQKYRPRYAVNSQDEIAVFLQGNSPPAQLRGSLGVGWLPPSDVDTPQDPHASTGAPGCVRIMNNAGIALTPRQAYYQAMVDCDVTLLTVEAAALGGGLSTVELERGIDSTSPHFAYAATFGGTAASSPVDKVGVARDVGFVPSCGCFSYLGSRNIDV
jgi:L-ascorbate metabolism protein UlaG (beta-lactamase superfamily)